MPVIVAGMPAAGTAAVAECLRACGVRLADGCGSPMQTGGGTEPWGLIAAAGSHFIPLWLARYPSARVVVCLRNPLEVAVSLHERHGLPFEAGIGMWRSFVETILRTTTDAHRIVAHYDAFRRDPAAATARLAAAIDTSARTDPEAVRRAWHTGRSPRFTAEDLVGCGLDVPLVDAYRLLSVEAGHAEARAAEPLPDRDLMRRLAAACRSTRTTAGLSSDVDAAVAALRAEIAGLRDRLADRDDEFRELLDDLREDLQDEHLSPAKRDYRRTICGVRDLVKRHVPTEGVVAIISKGDDTLLRHKRCTAWHFPRDARGGYLGYHPAGNLAAIANLETTRAAGATHLLVPETHAWWLTSYPGFRRHLERHARLVESRPGAGMLYDLTPPAATTPAPADTIAEALRRRPQVLAWDAPAAKALLDGCRVFEPPTASPQLPYIDASIDIVAVAKPTPERLAEARRVASVAVIDVADEPVVHWVRRPVAPEPPSVSIVMPVHGNWPLTEACLRALLPSLPAAWPVELVIVDDASPDETPDRLAAIAADDHRIVLLRNAENLGFVGSSNRGAETATGDYLVFLNNDTVPLPGWLPPLIHTFQDFPAAGAVGGKLLFPDGRLQEAGGIVFDDGSACQFGREHPDPAWHLFNHVRPVDYVSGALLATPRHVFLAMGGFDSDYAPGYYEDTDYCLRLREAGHDVVMQPESVVVHVEGGTAGTDHAVGMKRFQEINRLRFRSRHAAALMRQRKRPPAFDRDIWGTLAHRVSGADR